MDHREDVLGKVSGAFKVLDLVEHADRIAEEEGLSDDRRLFELLFPTEGMADVDVQVYKAHAREICARRKAGEDTRPATDAEVLLLMSGTSLVAPLSQGGAALFHHVFERVFGRVPGVSDGAPPEVWAGQLKEDLAAARRKARKEWRR